MLKWKKHLYVSSFLKYLGITLSHFLDHSIVSGPMNLLFMGSLFPFAARDALLLFLWEGFKYREGNLKYKGQFGIHSNVSFFWLSLEFWLPCSYQHLSVFQGGLTRKI